MNSYIKSNGTSTGDCISQKPGNSAKTCGCGGAGCAACGGTGYVRPRFFAGQLLTEEDLQSLSDYVVAKNRLHNRHFFGEGVVCGLEVACHPCGGGKVVVAPGYALDCCGNDIVLSCPVEVDINAMVRELRINTLGGYDCGDPCAPPKKTDCNDNSKKGSGGEDQPPARRYCLYIRYCEEQTDLVTPYGTDEPCVNPGCEPTRIKEGVRFELRCDEGDENPDNLFTRIGHCLGDLVALERVAREGKWQRTVIATQVRAEQAISKSLPINFDLENLEKAVETLKNSVPTLSEEKAHERTAINPKELQAIFDATLNVVSLVAGYLTEKESKVRATISTSDSTEGGSAFVNAQRAVVAAYDYVGQEIGKILETPVERASAHALFEISTLVFNEAVAAGAMQTPSVNQKAKNKRVVAENLDAPLRIDSMARLFIAYGSLALPSLLRVQASSSEALRNWLLERIDKSPWLTDCSLHPDIMAIRLQSPKQSQDLERSDVRSIDTAGEKLLEALLRYLRQCICRAFLPPCPPCDDTAVLLACLKVRDCEVIEICNLERTFVLSPVAFRYWVPPLHWFGEFIEKLCCRPIHLQCNHPYSRQEFLSHLSETELLNRAMVVLTEQLGVTQDQDRQRFLKILSALGELMCYKTKAMEPEATPSSNVTEGDAP